MRQFLTVFEASAETGMSAAHIQKLVTIIERNPSRYTKADIFGGNGKKAVRFVALLDAVKYGGNFDGADRYEPVKLEQALGIVPQGVEHITTKDVAAEIADMLVKAFTGVSTCRR